MPSIFIASRRKKIETLRREYPGAEILDVTSKGEEPWVRFSPFFPVGGIPVPFWLGQTSQTVEGVWQALKVFEHEGTDLAKLKVTSMSGIKRSSGSKRGRVEGHRKMDDKSLLDYRTARHQIYLPSYLWVLQNRLQTEVQQLREMAATKDIVLLDYETNEDVNDLSSPMSHAGLIKRFLNGDAQ